MIVWRECQATQKTDVYVGLNRRPIDPFDWREHDSVVHLLCLSMKDVWKSFYGVFVGVTLEKPVDGN